MGTGTTGMPVKWAVSSHSSHGKRLGVRIQGCCSLSTASTQVTVGEEGFFAAGDPAIAGNPAGGWAGQTGQDFRNNHVSIYITSQHPVLNDISPD